MVDNVAITAGSGTTIAADDIGGGVLAQRVKIVWGPDGTGNDADVASGKPLPVQLRVSDGTAWTYGAGAVGGGTQRVTLASDDPAVAALVTGPIAIVGKTTIFSLTLSLDTNAYASGDVLADTQQADAFFRIADGTALIQSLTVIDEDDQGAAFTVYLFQANRSLGTENSAPSISDANARDCLGFIDVATGDYKDLGGVKIAHLRNLALPVKAVSGTDDLYIGVVNGSGAPTYTASGIKLVFGVLQD